MRFDRDACCSVREGRPLAQTVEASCSAVVSSRSCEVEGCEIVRVEGNSGGCFVCIGWGGSTESLAELGELDLHAVAPATDLDRGLAHGAADGADVAVVLAEELDDALAEDAIFGAQAGDARREVGADGLGE